MHPSLALTIKWERELKAKTGRSLEEWKRLAKKEGPKDEETLRTSEVRAALRRVYERDA